MLLILDPITVDVQGIESTTIELMLTTTADGCLSESHLARNAWHASQLRWLAASRTAALVRRSTQLAAIPRETHWVLERFPVLPRERAVTLSGFCSRVGVSTGHHDVGTLTAAQMRALERSTMWSRVAVKFATRAVARTVHGEARLAQAA